MRPEPTADQRSTGAVIDDRPAKEPASRPPSDSQRVLHELARFSLVIVFAMVVITFSIWKPHTYLTWDNVRGTLDSQAVIVMTALAAMLPLLVGEFDLSVGANAGLAGLLVVGLNQNQHLAPVLAIIFAILGSTLVGLFNGIIVVRLKVNAFVATLGMATLVDGVGSAYTHGQDLPAATAGLINIGSTQILGLPMTVVVALVTAIVLFVFLQKLPAGRRLLAVGANRTAAELTGIRPNRQILLSFVAAGAVAGLGGALYGAELGSASLATGDTLLLPAFAGAFLGATAITPGRFNVIGTVVGVLLLAFTVAGLQQVGVASWAQDVVTGVALIVAVAVSTWMARLRTARLRRAQLDALTAGHAVAGKGFG